VPFLGVLLKKNEDVDAFEETRARKGVPIGYQKPSGY
jgi:hypothetical protein